MYKSEQKGASVVYKLSGQVCTKMYKSGQECTRGNNWV